MLSVWPMTCTVEFGYWRRFWATASRSDWAGPDTAALSERLRKMVRGWMSDVEAALAEQVTDRGTGISQSLLQRNSPQCSNPQS